MKNKQINKSPKGLTILEFRFPSFILFVILRNNNDDNYDIMVIHDK
jgi:hypothetical protein